MLSGKRPTAVAVTVAVTVAVATISNTLVPRMSNPNPNAFVPRVSNADADADADASSNAVLPRVPGLPHPDTVSFTRGHAESKPDADGCTESGRHTESGYLPKYDTSAVHAASRT